MRAVRIDPLGREDRAALAVLVLLPLVVALPRLLGFFLADPVLIWGEVSIGHQEGAVPGAAYIDPNAGYATQALGALAANEWLSGRVPWWNPFTGVGLPLAAEYQPGAFFPLTFLLLAWQGPVLLQVALQILSGLGAYGLLRQLGVGRMASLMGGVLYSFNGTLAWHAHGPAQPVPFLPWMLWGIERARTASATMFALAMAMSLLAGFPETAYINGLLALAWFVLRLFQEPARARMGFARRIMAGGLAGVAIAAPQILSFLLYLPEAELGGHGGRFAREPLAPGGLVASLIAPYIHGPIFAFPTRPMAYHVWGGIGGCVTFALLVTAAFGLAVRRCATSWLLAAWFALCLAKSFALEPATTLMNLLPGVPLAAFYRYAPPSWELAIVILAAFGIDALARSRPQARWAWLAAIAAFGAGLYALWDLRAVMFPELRDQGPPRVWARNSMAWAITSAVVVLALLRWRTRRAVAALAVFLALESIALLAIPTFANPRGGRVDSDVVGFLRANLGLQRFYSLGPIQPNYGAYFGIASINHNYLPVARRWTAFVDRRLGRGNEPEIFNGHHDAAAENLRRNLASYEWAGVKYVIAATKDPAPFADGAGEPRRVHAGPRITVYELPSPRPYFEVTRGRCRLDARERTRLSLTCAEPSTLVRRELFFPGWTATVNGIEAPIAEHGSLFQEIALPAGASEVRFDYAPPYIGWAWLVAAAGFLTLVGGFVRRGGSKKRS